MAKIVQDYQAAYFGLFYCRKISHLSLDIFPLRRLPLCTPVGCVIANSAHLGLEFAISWLRFGVSLRFLRLGPEMAVFVIKLTESTLSDPVEE